MRSVIKEMPQGKPFLASYTIQNFVEENSRIQTLPLLSIYYFFLVANLIVLIINKLTQQLYYPSDKL